MTRRIADICFALVAIALLAPALIVMAVAIRVDSAGSPLYRGWRVGRGGRRFRMWKFRTMVPGADKAGPGITGNRDPRITRLGQFLRKTKLDELPQFFNLLAGDLTIVGPRAEVPEIVDHYTSSQRRVLAAKPGVTGVGALHYTVAQAPQIPEGVPADRYYVEHLLNEKLQLEMDYERSRNAVRDLRVIAVTAAMVLGALLPPFSRPRRDVQTSGR